MYRLLVGVQIFLFTVILQAPASPDQGTGLDMAAFQKKYFITHDGSKITELGLSHVDIAEISSVVKVSPDEILGRRVDIGDGTKNGLVVSANTSVLCGASGNCAMWLFCRIKGKWRPLRGDWGPDLYTESAAFAFVQPQQGGLDQLVLLNHWRAGEANVEVWWFDQAKQEYFSNNNYCWDGAATKAHEGECH